MNNTKCIFHHNDHPDYLCPRHAIAKTGPTRVLIDKKGNADTPIAAQAQYGIAPSVVFLRSDSWSLGAPPQFEKIAYEMQRWVAFAKYPFISFEPIGKYRRS